MRVPSLAEEAARDLVRAREAARQDLMRARHRVSKLLLRHGIVYAAARRGPRLHDRVAASAALRICWRRRRRSTTRMRRWCWPPAAAPGWTRRSSRWPNDSEFTALTPAVGVPARHRDADRVRAGGRDRRLGPVHRRRASAPTSAWCPASTPPGRPAPRAAITKTGNTHVRRLLVEAAWHHRTIYRGPGVVLQRRWDQAPAAARARAHAGNQRLHQRWVNYTAAQETSGDRQRRRRPRTGRLVLVTGGAARLTHRALELTVGVSDRNRSARSNPPPGYEQPDPGNGSRPRSFLDQRYAPAEHTVLR